MEEIISEVVSSEDEMPVAALAEHEDIIIPPITSSVISPDEIEAVVKKEDTYDHKVYAYLTDVDGNIIGAYQGKNPPEDYTHVFDYPLEAGASIKYGEVTISSAYIQQTKAALYAQINAEYQEKLAKLQSTIASLSLRGLDTTTAKAAYIKLQQQYKNALLDVANITVKE